MRKMMLTISAVLLTAIILCGVGTFFLEKQSPYAAYQGEVYSVEEINEAEILLAGFPEADYVLKKQQVQTELEELNYYLRIMEYQAGGKGYLIDEKGYARYFSREDLEYYTGRYHYSEEQCRKRMSLLRMLPPALKYATDYPPYTEQTKNQADRMLRSSLFTERKKREIRKTLQDYENLTDLNVNAVLGVGAGRLLESRLSVIIGIIIGIICAYITVVKGREWNRNLPGHYIRYKGVLPFMTAGFFLLHGAEFLAVSKVWYLGYLSCPIQSLPMYQSSCFRLSIGALYLLSVFFRVAALVILFLLMEGIFSMANKVKAGIMIAVCLVGSVLSCWLSSEWNVATLIHSEKIIGVYHNILLLGVPVNSAWILLTITATALIASYVFAARQLDAAAFLEKTLAEKRYLEEINNRYNETRMIRHDLNNQLTTISYLISQDKKEEALHLVQEITKELEQAKPAARTGRNALDALLTDKMITARENKVTIQCDFRVDLADSEMTDYELCSVFGNLLDNALEAATQCEEAERTIQITTCRQMEMLCIFVVNPYKELHCENGKFATTKQDKENHGLGLRQIERIVRRYHGTLHVDTENRMFTVSILINEKKKIMTTSAD